MMWWGGKMAAEPQLLEAAGMVYGEAVVWCWLRWGGGCGGEGGGSGGGWWRLVLTSAAVVAVVLAAAGVAVEGDGDVNGGCCGEGGGRW
ncbi:hypothetical protein Tco_0562720 [Tanacetum coccineum]